MSTTVDVLDIPLLVMGEGPIWSPGAQAFFWLDIKQSRLHRLSWPQMRHERFELPAQVGCMALCEDGDLALVLPDGLYRFRPGANGLSLIGSFDAGGANRRSNDGAVDRQGRFWFSTVADPGWQHEATGRLFCCDHTGKIQLVLDGICMPNGIAADANEDRLYLSDSHPNIRRIWAFGLDGTGVGLGRRRIFFDTKGWPGRPDGAAIDEENCYWMAGVGGGEMLRLTPDGNVDRVIPLPVSHPTKPCFGGPDLDVLLITTIQPGAVGLDVPATEVPGGSVLIMRPGVRGLPQKMFSCR